MLTPLASKHEVDRARPLPVLYDSVVAPLPVALLVPAVVRLCVTLPSLPSLPSLLRVALRLLRRLPFAPCAT